MSSQPEPQDGAPRIAWAHAAPTLLRERFAGPSAAVTAVEGAPLLTIADADRLVAEAQGPTVLQAAAPAADAYRVTAEVKLAAPKHRVSLQARGVGIALWGDPEDPAAVRAQADSAQAAAAAESAVPQRLRLWPYASQWALDAAGQQAVAREFAGLPGWRERWFRLTLDVRRDEVSAWLDGRFISSHAAERGGGDLRLALNAGDRIRLLEILPLPDARFLPVDLAAYHNNDALAGGDLGDGHAFADERLRGEGMIGAGSIPFHVAWQSATPNNVDLGKTEYREFLPYVHTDAMSNDPRRVLLRAPKRYYDRAHLICASDAEEGSLPAAALRMIKAGRGHAVTAEFDVPRWSDHGGAEPLQTGNGRLWLMTVPLDPCAFQEFLAAPRRARGDAERSRGAAEDERFLEIDLTRRIGLSSEKFPQPMGPPSAVHVLALTLEEAPVEMVVTSDQVGHIFARPRVPTMKVRLRSRRDEPQDLRIEAQVRGPYGEQSRHERTVALAPRGSQTVVLELPQTVNGKFDVTVRCGDAGGQRPLQRSTSFALLPHWERRATTDSPFGMWCFFEKLFGAGPEIAGHLMALAGVRWTIAGFVLRDDPRESAARAEVLARYGIALNGALLCGIGNTAWDGPGDVEARIAGLRREPPSDTFQVMWETTLSRRTLNTFPPELLGQPPLELTEEEQRHLDACLQTGVAYSRRARDEFPRAKLIFGNGFPAFIGTMLRAGYPKHYLDGLALDFDLFTAMPERQPGVLYAPFNGLHYLKRYQQMYGYEDVPRYLTEAIYAPTAPGWLTEREQAEYYVRTHVLGLAAGVRRFCMATEIWDPGSEFGYGHYGPVGLCRRPPELNPRESFCAYATMTAMLDQAAFDGLLAMGSPSVFGVRFRRPDGRALHVLWTLRDRREAVLRLAAPAEASITDLFGNTHTQRRDGDHLSLALSSSPVYVEGIGEVLGVELGEPQRVTAGAGSWRLLAGFESLDGWTRESGQHDALERLSAYAPLAAGGIELEPVQDERGRLLQVALAEQSGAHPLQTLYTMLRRTGEPLVIPEEAQAIGACVHGNSCGGRVFFELTDAKGRSWLAGRADTFVDFDGHRCLEVALPHAPRGRRVEPTGFEAWVCDDRGAEPAYPFTLTRLILESRSHVIRAADLEPVPQRAYFVERIVLR